MSDIAIPNLHFNRQKVQVTSVNILRSEPMAVSDMLKGLHVDPSMASIVLLFVDDEQNVRKVNVRANQRFYWEISATVTEELDKEEIAQENTSAGRAREEASAESASAVRAQEASAESAAPITPTISPEPRSVSPTDETDPKGAPQAPRERDHRPRGDARHERR